MKNTCRNGYISLIALVVMLLFVMSTLTACGVEESHKGSYHLNVVDHTSDFYVNDFAGVFSEEEKDKLMANAVSFDEEYSGIQVVITTVKTLDSAVEGYEYVVEDENGNRVDDSKLKPPSRTPKFTIEQISYSMYSEYGIGQDDMGILILFATEDREVRIETGRNMQFYITDILSGRILDNYGMEYFAEDQFAEGLVSVQTAVINEIKSQVEPNWFESSKQDKEEDKTATLAPVVGDAENVSGENANATTNTNKEKEPGKGLLYLLFGGIAAAFAAHVFISKEDKEALKREKKQELGLMQTNYDFRIEKIEKAHQEEVEGLKRDYKRLVQVRDTDIQELNNALALEREKYGTLKTEYEELEEKYSRAQRLHPEYNFEEEIQEMIENEYKAAAKEIDEKLAEVLIISATKDNYDVFNKALLLIDSAQLEVKKYVTSDRTAIEKLYDDAVQLKKEHDRVVQEEKDRRTANDAYEKIKEACNNNPIGSYKNFAILSGAFAVFSGLTAAQKQFFPDCKLISELERLHRTAESDFNNHEAARKAEENVENIIGGMYSADEDDRDKLERAMKCYRNLSEVQKAYFSADLLSKLRKLIDEADEDHRSQKRRREQQEAARRRRTTSSSSFSSSHRSSYSGRGGRPSGGGASRRF